MSDTLLYAFAIVACLTLWVVAFVQKSREARFWEAKHLALIRAIEADAKREQAEKEAAQSK